MNPRDFLELQEQIDSLKSQSDRAVGALNQDRLRLQRDFDVESVEAARKLITRMDKEQATKEQQLQDELEQFKVDYAEHIA